MARTGSETRGSAMGDSIPNPMDGAITSPVQRTPGDLSQADPQSYQETENLEMPDGTWVISDDSKFWLYRPDFLCSLLYSRHLLERSSPAHTRQLLAGALTAGGRTHTREESTVEIHPRSRESYIHWLAGAYQTTHATPEVMRHAAERLRAAGNVRIADHFLHVADEEAGHDRLALKDLEALGVRAAEFVSGVRPAGSVALVQLFKGYAHSDNPIAVLGYVYVLERMALFQTQAMIDAIEAIIPRGTMATRCLRVHSAVGTDARHVPESIEVISQLDDEDRVSIVRAVFETAACRPPTDYPGDAAFRDVLSRYKN
jgi:hypothetical protein